MGNTQSAPTPRRRAQNKLSKPKTNNASTTTLLTLKAPPAAGRSNSEVNSAQMISTRYSDLSTVVGENENAREDAPRKRISLFKSKSSQAKQRPAIETGVDRHPPEPHPVERPVHSWSKRASSASAIVREPVDVPAYIPPSQRPNRMSLQPTRPSQTSLRPSLKNHKSTSQLDLAEDEMPSRYDNRTPTNPLGARTTSETDLYGPIRRKSLQQPGIATRRSFVEGDPRQSLPSQRISRDVSSEAPQDHCVNISEPTSLPLSNLAALRQRLNEAPGPRTETPNDMDYGHIGAFKLGSLRIINGPASPTPSINRPSSLRSENGRESRGSDVDRYHLGQRSKTFNVTLDKPWMPRSESPLRQSHERERCEPLIIETQLPIPDSLFTQYGLFTTDSPTRSLDLAREYMEDLPLSPFSFQNSPLPSPGLQVRSKHTALEDDLFSIEARTPSPDAANRLSRSLDSAYDGLASPRVTLGADCESAQTLLAKADSGYSSNVSLRSFKGKSNKPPVPAKEAPPTPPKDALAREPVSRMASSNYSVDSSSTARRDVSASSQLSRNPLSRNASSNYSAASYSSTASDSTVRDNKRLSFQPSPEPMSRNASSNYSIESLSSTISEATPKEPEAVGKLLPPTRASPPPPVPSKSAEQIWQATQTKSLAVVQPQPIRRQSFDPAVLGLGVKQDKKQNLAEIEAPASESATQWKVMKRIESLDPSLLFTVQAVRPNSPALSIPPVPQEASRRLGERVDAFPVASIPNTIKGDNALRRTISKETLGTIFSVGSAEHREEPTPARLQGALPPVPKPLPVLKPEFKAAVVISKPAVRESQQETSAGAEPNRRNTLQQPEPLPSLGYTSSPKAETRRSLPPDSGSLERSSTTTQPEEAISTPSEAHPTTLTRAISEPPTGFYSIRNLEANPFVPQSVPSALPPPVTTTRPRADPVKRKSVTRGESQGGLRGAYKAQESNPSIALQAKKSVDSAVEVKISALPPPTPTAAVKPSVPARPKDPIRAAKRAFPPQAHEKFSRASMQRQLQVFENSLLALQQAALTTADGDGLMSGFDYSTLSAQNSRVKSPPPVTMQTQKKLVPVNLKALPFQPPTPAPVFRAPFQPPTPPPNYPPSPLIARATNKQSPQPEAEAQDPWAAQKQFWFTQRQSADIALQARRSQDMSRPSLKRNSMEYQRPRLQPQSSDDYLATQSREVGINARKSIGMGQAKSAAPLIMPNVEEAARRSIEFHRWQRDAEQQTPSQSRRASLESTQSWHAWRNVAMQSAQQQLQQQILSHRSSVESTQSFQSARSNSLVTQNRYSVPLLQSTQVQAYSDRGSYDHTYGSSQHMQTQKTDEKSYDGYSDASETYEESNLSRVLHPSSTEDMLVLKRLSSFRSESEERGVSESASASASPNWVVHNHDHGGGNGNGDGRGDGGKIEGRFDGSRNGMGFRRKAVGEGMRRVRVGA